MLNAFLIGASPWISLEELTVLLRPQNGFGDCFAVRRGIKRRTEGANVMVKD